MVHMRHFFIVLTVSSFSLAQTELTSTDQQQNSQKAQEESLLPDELPLVDRWKSAFKDRNKKQQEERDAFDALKNLKKNLSTLNRDLKRAQQFAQKTAAAASDPIPNFDELKQHLETVKSELKQATSDHTDKVSRLKDAQKLELSLRRATMIETHLAHSSQPTLAKLVAHII